ncbi:MAG: NUDIX domain-containing protein [Bacteroidota bacterium]
MIIPVKPQSYECTITVDCNVFGFQDQELKILLVKRAIEPYKDCWLLPGGIMEEGQTAEEAVDIVLYNLTGIYDVHQAQVQSYSAVDRHPVKRVVTISYYALIRPENHPLVIKDNVQEAKWHSLSDLPEKWGFDHQLQFQTALDKLRANLRNHFIVGELLPEKFTLKELQDLYESILDEKLDRRNFRKKILQLEILENTHEKKIGAKGGPDLYKIRK